MKTQDIITHMNAHYHDRRICYCDDPTRKPISEGGEWFFMPGKPMDPGGYVFPDGTVVEVHPDGSHSVTKQGTE